jgi:hypothetical protein
MPRERKREITHTQTHDYYIYIGVYMLLMFSGEWCRQFGPNEPETSDHRGVSWFFGRARFEAIGLG